MASGESLRLSKLTTEAFSRLKNDHEQFLEAYEKPTQIYRFLQARHSLKSLFMHRNLSYMQHRNHRRKRRANKIRINDLLKYRKQCKPQGTDLSSQIKSDNFLKITFHDLEQGIDFSHLLSTALTGDIKSALPTNHTPSLMEVEVLLYNCHQHTSEASFCPCSSTSLGKFDVEYTPTATKNAKIVSLSDSKHTLTVPESKLIWRGGNRGTGSLMLAFQARPRTGKANHKKPLVQSLTKVSVELNKMNHSEILQLRQANHTLSPATPTCTSSETCGARTTKNLHKAREGGSSESGEGSVDVHDGLERRPGSTGTGTYSKTPRKTRSKVKDSPDGCMDTVLATTRDHSACNGPSENISNHVQDSVTSSFPRKGFIENGASLLTKLAAQRNGLSRVNLLNGFTGSHQPKVPSCDSDSDAFLNSNEANCSLTVSIPCTTYIDGPHRNGKLCSNHQNCPKKRQYKVPARRHSELQIVLNREKTPDRRLLGAKELPVYAEGELSATQCETCRAEDSQTQLDNGACSVASVDPNTVVSTGKIGGIKRSLSESDAHPLSPDVGSPPPEKMARLTDKELTEMCMEDEVEEREGVTETLEEHDKMNTDLSNSVSLPPSPSPSQLPSSEEKLMTEKRCGPATGTMAPEGLFCAEMVVFDSRGECLLDKGEYSILMQKCPQKDSSSSDTQPPPLVTFAPLSWSSVFGGGDQSGVQQSESLMLRFSLSWSQGPPKHRLLSEMETALDLQRIRNEYFGPAVRPATATCSAATGASNTAFAAVPTQETVSSEKNNKQHDTPVASSPQPPHTADNSSSSRETVAAVVAGGERVCGCEGGENGDGGEVEDMEVGGGTGKDARCHPLKDTPPHGVSRDGYKEDNDEYFTATEASTSSSVADSTELAQCQSAPSTRAPSVLPNPSTGQPVGKAGRIIYNFLYNNNSLQQTESRENMNCPWCSQFCEQLYCLLKHMSLCHPRFLFTYTPMEGGSVIDVHVNKMYEAGQTTMDRDPVERSGMSLRQRWKGPLKCLPCTALIVERRERVEEDLSEFVNDGSWKRGYNVKRQYYHSQTCLPMVPEEIDADSEAELESIGKWQRTCSQKMIDEFTDVNKGEKEMMKLWNLYAMEKGMTAYKQIPIACVQFTQDRGPEIVRKNIVNSFLAHLISLCDFGLISPSVIRRCMEVLNTTQPVS